MSAPQRYPDLDAEVHPDSVPSGLAAELPDLYGSLFATLDWFETHDDSPGHGACVLAEPRHVLLFDRAGDTVEVLNKAFRIAPADARRACRALFRAFPDVRRIHLEVMFLAAELELPRRVLYWTDHMVVDLPATVDEYTASLGRSTRRNLRLYENRVHRDFPDAAVEIMRPGDRAGELVDLFLAWKNDRFREHGRTTYWERDPALAARFVELLRRCGEAQVTTLAGREAAISFAFPVGEEVCSQETSFDPSLEQYHLGLLAQYWVACDAVRRGAKRFNLLWSTTQYKERLGATPRRATALSVFRSRSARLRSLSEAREVAGRTWRRDSSRLYWRARHAAGRAVHGIVKRNDVHSS